MALASWLMSFFFLLSFIRTFVSPFWPVSLHFWRRRVAMNVLRITLILEYIFDGCPA
jgi:hypothetical protein